MVMYEKLMSDLRYEKVDIVSNDSIEYVWILDFYDVPLSGICYYKGEFCFFLCVNIGGWLRQNGGLVLEKDEYTIFRMSTMEEIKWKIKQLIHVVKYWLKYRRRDSFIYKRCKK